MKKIVYSRAKLGNFAAIQQLKSFMGLDDIKNLDNGGFFIEQQEIRQVERNGVTGEIRITLAVAPAAYLELPEEVEETPVVPEAKKSEPLVSPREIDETPKVVVPSIHDFQGSPEIKIPMEPIPGMFHVFKFNDTGSIPQSETERDSFSNQDAVFREDLTMEFLNALIGSLNPKQNKPNVTTPTVNIASRSHIASRSLLTYMDYLRKGVGEINTDSIKKISDILVDLTQRYPILFPAHNVEKLKEEGRYLNSEDMFYIAEVCFSMIKNKLSFL